MPIPQPKFSTLPRDVNDIAAKGRPEIGPVRIVSPFFLRHTQVIPPTPGSRNEAGPQLARQRDLKGAFPISLGKESANASIGS